MKKLMLAFGFLSTQLFAATLINGAGATFPYPIYSKWFSDYQKVDKDVQINYQSIGSGGGIRQFLEKTVDFGASDAPMSDEQLSKAGQTVLHIPTVIGAVVVTYNLPDAPAELKLTGDIVADVFLGKITKWSDPKIAALNPGLKSTGDILVVHRSDGSGTTNIFTDYLAKVSPEWVAKAGKGTAVNWPVGLGGKGNEGVTALVKQTPGSLGYVELIYATSNNLPYASLKNKAGQFVKPTLASVTAAAEGALKTIPEDFRVSITEPAGAKSYPISGFTYLLLYKQPADPVRAEKMVKFLKWALKDGQKSAQEMGYSALPASLIKKVGAKVDTIEVKKAASKS